MATFRLRIRWIVLMGTVAVAASVHASDDDGQLVANPNFHAAGPEVLPTGWTAWVPAAEKAACTLRSTSDGLRVDAPGNPFAVGGVWQDLAGVRAGEAYAVEAACRLDDVPFPYRSAIVRLTWMKAGKPAHVAGMLVRGPEVADGAARFHDVLVAPEGADGARLSLEVRWPQGGRVLWRQVSVRPADPPPPRKVKIGTVYLRPRNTTPEENLELFCRQIDAAGKLGLDVVCLPEAITQVGTSQSAPECAEPIPGPSTKRLGRATRDNRLWVVAGLYEQAGDLVYNTAVLLDRQGRLAGTYRKVHLPREEWKKGVTPADAYPVFQTDFGTVAVQICYDYFFPEATEIFALGGAEIVFAPTWGTTFADREGRVEGETIFRVRARDNGVYLVPSVYDGNSLIIDPMGRILASSDGQSGVFWHEVDLSRREPLWWVGYWRSIGPRDRMPTTYQPLLEDPPKPTYGQHLED
ncbi:MAG: carbon-nitrogen hydrolase family protein [Planctomycetota bacterium]|jgi:predicted amidohydrolase